MVTPVTRESGEIFGEQPSPAFLAYAVSTATGVSLLLGAAPPILLMVAFVLLSLISLALCTPGVTVSSSRIDSPS